MRGLRPGPLDDGGMSPLDAPNAKGDFDALMKIVVKIFTEGFITQQLQQSFHSASIAYSRRELNPEITSI